MNKERIVKSVGKAVAGGVIITELLTGSGKALANEKKDDSPLKQNSAITLITDETITNAYVPTIGEPEFSSPDYKRSPFTDIYAEDFSNSYRIAIESLWENGIINGYENNGQLEFRPDDPLTRGQAAKMVVKTIESLMVNTEETGNMEFIDVSSNDPFYEYIKKAAKYEIVRGDNNGRFNTYENVTRAQLITMCVRAADFAVKGKFSTPFKIPEKKLDPVVYNIEPHGQNIQQAEENRILKDLEGFDATWDPEKQISRKEAARIIANTYYNIQWFFSHQK